MWSYLYVSHDGVCETQKNAPVKRSQKKRKSRSVYLTRDEAVSFGSELPEERRQLWNEWIYYRWSSNKKLVESSLGKLKLEFAEKPIVDLRASVHASITNGWTGLHDAPASRNGVQKSFSERL